MITPARTARSRSRLVGLTATATAIGTALTLSSLVSPADAGPARRIAEAPAVQHQHRAPEPVTPPGASPIAPTTVLAPAEPSVLADQVGVNFVSGCAYSHSLMDDPIVFPGQPGAAHRHDFFGNRTTNAFSTYQSLLSGPTTCRRRLDTAAYWAPSLVVNGSPVLPARSSVYYKGGPVPEPSIVAFPAGLRMIAGDVKAITPQGVRLVSWNCGADGESLLTGPTPPSCPPGTQLKAHIKFPQCWNGRDLDSPDHKSHMAYPVRTACPATHPIALPALQLNVVYNVNGDPAGLGLASGSIHSMHADFFNAWNQAELERLVRACINPDLQCQGGG